MNGDHTTSTTSSGDSERQKFNGHGAPPAAAASTRESGNGRKTGKSDGFGCSKGSGESPREQNSANNDDGRRESQSLRELSSARVAAAAIAAVEDGVLNGVELMPEWRSEVEGWSQVSARL